MGGPRRAGVVSGDEIGGVISGQANVFVCGFFVD